jgi:hypothetical protein
MNSTLVEDDKEVDDIKEFELPNLKGPYFRKIDDNHYEVTEAGKKLLKLIDLKNIAIQYAGLSGMNFNQLVNGYMMKVHKTVKPKYFTYKTMMAFQEAIGKYIDQIIEIADEAVDVANELKPKVD